MMFLFLVVVVLLMVVIGVVKGRKTRHQGDTGVEIRVAQYSHYDIPSDKGIPDTCLTAKRTQYCGIF